MAEDFREEWKLFQAALGYACVDEIKRQYFYERDEELKHRQVICLLEYMESSFELEFMSVVLKYLSEQIDVDNQLLLRIENIEVMESLLEKV